MVGENYPFYNKTPRFKWFVIGSVVFIGLMLMYRIAKAEDNWLITSYCACKKCCLKTDGITASGKVVKYGYVACNWLKFGTKVKIEGLGVFEVQDRGAKSLFGSKNNHIRHLDVYLPTHKEALRFGKRYLKVEVLK